MTGKSRTFRWDAREYLRVSDDKQGRSTDEQHDENQEAADAQGWTLGPAYADPDFSASKYARKARPDYAKLISDLEHDRFGAGVLQLWESSRGGRRTGEWVQLIELCEGRGVRIYITTHERLYNPANARDRKALLEDAIGNEYASAETSQRVRRATRASANKGRPHGRAPYGFARTYGPHPETGKVVMLSQDPDPAEAPNVVDLFERLDRGNAFNAIERDWAAQGIRRRDGRPFTASDLRSIAKNAAYAGLRVYTPGRTTRATNGLKSTEIKASWPALVERDLFDRVQRRLSDPKRVTTRGSESKYLLSLIVRCGVCGNPLTGLPPGGEGKNLRTRTQYRCAKKGCVKVAMDELDEHVEDEILTYLERDDVYQFLASAEDQDDDELRRVRADLGTVNDELEELQTALDAGQISAVMAGRSEAKKLERRAALEARERELMRPIGWGPIEPGRDVRERWADAPLSARRETARALLVPEVLGLPKVVKTSRRGAPVADRVVWETAD